MSAHAMISRREAVRRLTALAGGALSSSTLGALLSGCGADPAVAAWQPEVLEPAQLDLLTVVVDRIIPPTDTPGAAEAGVPAFIDLLLARWADDAERRRVLDGLDSLGANDGGTGFLALDAEAQTRFLGGLDDEAVRAREEDRDPLPFFATLKEWTLAGYYTSEVGATRELRWIAVPGRYDADLPLEEGDRAWA